MEARSIKDDHSERKLDEEERGITEVIEWVQEFFDFFKDENTDKDDKHWEEIRKKLGAEEDEPQSVHPRDNKERQDNIRRSIIDRKRRKKDPRRRMGR